MASSMFGDIITGLLPGVGQLSDVGAALVGFFATVTDGKMWRSLAWIVLGVVLIIAGGAGLLKGAATAAVRDVVAGGGS